MLNYFEKAVAKASEGKDDELGFMLKLSAGRFVESPFDEETMGMLRKDTMEAIGFEEAVDVVAEGQVFHLNLLAAILRA